MLNNLICLKLFSSFNIVYKGFVKPPTYVVEYVRRYSSDETRDE